MVPGMAHCGGGPGPDTWERLAPIVEWLEHGTAPESLTVRRLTDGSVDNERILCPHPQRAVYSGTGDPDDPANWIAANFMCE